MNWILEKLELGIMVLDEEGRFSYVNSFCIEREISLADFMKKKYYEVLRSLEFITAVSGFLEGKEEEVVVEYKGRIYRIKPLRDSSLVLQVEDITELTKMKKIQKEFVASVSHELSTPVTALKGLLETALSAPEANRELLERALKRAEELEKLIKTVRFFILVESEPIKVREEICLRELFENILKDLEENVKSKRLKVVKDIISIRIKANRERLYMLFRNIVENAIKYNREGGRIFITLREISGNIVAEIRDTGRGIKREILPFVFEPFFKEGEEKGMGLGLAISKKIAESLGADIEISSSQGVGTKVKVTFKMLH